MAGHNGLNLTRLGVVKLGGIHGRYLQFFPGNATIFMAKADGVPPPDAGKQSGHFSQIYLHFLKKN
jgi:hypothetical protein